MMDEVGYFAKIFGGTDQSMQPNMVLKLEISSSNPDGCNKEIIITIYLYFYIESPREPIYEEVFAHLFL